MIGFAHYSGTPTTLDLNGPFLRFTSEPSAVTVDDGGSVTLSGIATAEFKGNPAATNTGTISYQWYRDGVALEDGTNISGSGTTTLTLSNLSNPQDTGKSFVLRANYVPSAYQSSSPVTAGTARSTGYAANGPLDTETSAVVTINPTIAINTQPSDATAAQAQDATFTVSASASDGSSLSYQWYVNGSPVSNSETVSGATSPTLTISSSTVSTNSVYVVITHPTAGNSPFTSNTATWSVVFARSIIQYDEINGSGTYFSGGSQNVFDSPLTLTGDSTNASIIYSVWAPERDVKVRITMAAAAGVSRNGNRGGYGGQSVFELTLEQGVEYTLKLGSQSQPTGGANGGGGGAFLYRKGQLLVALGGGGGAGTSGRGGDGGGVNIAGESGFGRNAGTGGFSYSVGSLPVTGFFPGGSVYGPANWNAETGGRVSGCPSGSDYFRRLYSPCGDTETNKFRDINGSLIRQTSVISRGFKSGLGHRNNGGNARGDNGGGGSGTVGGNAGTGNASGGGGGSGYSNGEVTVISTQLGGNSSIDAFITFEYTS